VHNSSLSEVTRVAREDAYSALGELIDRYGVQPSHPLRESVLPEGSTFNANHPNGAFGPIMGQMEVIRVLSIIVQNLEAELAILRGAVADAHARIDELESKKRSK
jgi:hypothetical protein